MYLQNNLGAGTPCISAPSNVKCSVRGVCWVKKQKRWLASITINSQQIRLGYFKEMEDAVAARTLAEERFGVPKIGGFNSPDARNTEEETKASRSGYWKKYRTDNPAKCKESHKSSQAKRKTNDPIGFMLFEAKRRAKKRNIEFSLDKSMITLPTHCEICGVRMELFTNKRFKSNAVSMDRIDNLKGYIEGNVKIICMDCNRWKSDCTDPKIFRAIADYIDRNLLPNN